MRLKHLVLPPSAGRYELLKPSRRTGADYFIDLLELYDGSNAEHVLDTMAESGFLHSAIPAPKNFILGVCSEEEIAEAKSALTPAAERILKAHLVDVFDDDVESPTLRMVLRSTDAANEGEEYSIPIPAGAFIVNATDHISTKTNHFAPILSDDGLVVCPQKLTGFTGPSANHVTHAYYTGTLAGNWERLPRVSFEPRDKARVGIVRPPSMPPPDHRPSAARKMHGAVP